MFGKCYEDLTPRLAIHPAQVGPIIEVFTPTEEEVEQTQTLIAAYETYQAADQGVLSFDGRMVDQPMIQAAERVLARTRTEEAN